ncbi:MAG: hypothetical protein M8357_12950 [Desulfobulbaceae bacterium]|nr:hypothetical protein [Desulfobulbaceae bacterium]
MRLITFSCLLLAGLGISALSTDCLAGNSWMMGKNGNELIMLNSMLLKRLGTIPKDGKISLSGDVVHENGKIIIKLYKLQQMPSSDVDTIFAPEIFDTDLPYQIFLREESLSEIPSPTSERNR